MQTAAADEERLNRTGIARVGCVFVLNGHGAISLRAVLF